MQSGVLDIIKMDVKRTSFAEKEDEYKEMLTNIFEELYEKSDEKFLSLINEYSIKDDKEIFDYILSLNSKLDLKTNKRQYLNNYIEDKYNEDNIDKDVEEYTKVIFNLIDNIRTYLEYIDDPDYLDKLYKVINPILESNTYDEIKTNLEFKLPIARGVSDITKEYKEKISSTIKEIKNLTTYDSEYKIKEGILETKEYVH